MTYTHTNKLIYIITLHASEFSRCTNLSSNPFLLDVCVYDCIGNGTQIGRLALRSRPMPPFPLTTRYEALSAQGEISAKIRNSIS
jgi:hypothetical protein